MNNQALQFDCCYTSTPEHLSSFTGRFLYIYTGKGSISVCDDKIIFKDKNRTTIIPFETILEIGKFPYPKTAKAGLESVKVIHKANGKIETILFTPTKSWATPIWETNKCVTVLLNALPQNLYVQ